jgi:hypothetical protein
VVCIRSSSAARPCGLKVFARPAHCHAVVCVTWPTASMPHGMGLTADRDKEVLCPLEGKTSLCLRPETSDSAVIRLPPRSDIVSNDHRDSVMVWYASKVHGTTLISLHPSCSHTSKVPARVWQARQSQPTKTKNTRRTSCVRP